MKDYNYNTKLNEYLEFITLPNILAEYINLKMLNNDLNDSFNQYYNDVKSLLNVIITDKKRIIDITSTILSNKFGYQVINLESLEIKN